MKLHWMCVCAIALAAACAPTTTSGGGLHDRGAQVASVSGTVLDAQSGEPISGAVVTGPEGAKARSDKQGRFLLSGLAVGTDGTIAARAADGRKASVPLRPLSEGRLEIVLHLR